MKKVYLLLDKLGRTLIIIFGLLLEKTIVVLLSVVLTCAAIITGLFIFMFISIGWVKLVVVVAVVTQHRDFLGSGGLGCWHSWLA